MASGTIRSNLEFVNADLYERDHLQHIADRQQRSEAARQWADRRRAGLLDAKVGFVSETVFSHESKLSLISHAQAMGYQVALYVDSVEAEHGAHRLVALCEREQTTLVVDKLPPWITAMLAQD